MTRGDLLITLTKISQGDHEAVRTAKNHDAEQRAEIERLQAQLATAKQEIARLREALSELHAQVQGECPSLLNEDSGGDAKLALEIESLLQEEPT